MLEQRDDWKTARVTIVERKSRVLLIAGGPSREYCFLRNQLFRDRDVTLDVLLQSSTAGASQEAANILTEFPELADDLFQYDCIVAFDPDWMKLDELQVELLDRWVAEQAGGLIVVAGPVFTPEWAGMRRGRDPRVDTIKTLYPVVFYSQGSPNLSLERFGGESAWPLSFTRDGLDAEFLWLEDEATASEAAWQSFDGVFGYYSVKDPKPGARCMRVSPTRTPRSMASCRSMRPHISMAPAACTFRPAAKCGDCGPWSLATLKRTTPS